MINVSKNKNHIDLSAEIFSIYDNLLIRSSWMKELARRNDWDLLFREQVKFMEDFDHLTVFEQQQEFCDNMNSLRLNIVREIFSNMDEIQESLKSRKLDLLNSSQSSSVENVYFLGGAGSTNLTPTTQ